MSTEVKIIGDTGKNTTQRQVHVHPFTTVTGVHQGLVALTHPLLELDPEFHPFLNEVNGTDMAIDAGFSGIPVFIYEDGDSSNADSGTTSADTLDKLEDTDSGKTFTSTVSVGMVVRNTSTPGFAHVTAIDGDTILSLDADIMGNAENYTIGAEWAGTAVAGGWNFTTDISIVGANNNDEAQFDNAFTSVMSNYVAITGKITLTTWDETLNELLLSFDLAGVSVGNSVDLNSYIDTGLLGTQQNFVIPKADLGLSTQTVDEMTLLITRSGGAKPTVDLDDIQFEKAGGSIVYKATTPKGTKFHVDEIRLRLKDGLAATVLNGTMLGLDPDALLGVATLTNGIVFTRSASGETKFSVTLKSIGDFAATGSEIINAMSDGTTTQITLLVKFLQPIILDGTNGDFLSFTISDDLSNLEAFSAAARGAVETQ